MIILNLYKIKCVSVYVCERAGTMSRLASVSYFSVFVLLGLNNS